MSILKQIKRKLNDSSAFTLAEALVAMLIMLMVSSIVAAGIPSAQRAYERVVLRSNAEVLLSTTISSLRNELGTSSNISIPNATSIRYIYSKGHFFSRIYLGKLDDGSEGNFDKKTIWVQRYDNVKNESEKPKPMPLVGREASTERLYVTYESISYNNSTNTITFNNLSVNRETGEKNITVCPTLSIHIID